jgi:outer membrane protein TolC
MRPSMKAVMSKAVHFGVIAFLAFYPAVSLGQSTPDSAPVLKLDDAIQIALGNNRDLKIASLEVDKSKWQIAAAKTRRLPSFHGYLFGSGNITSPVFTFKEGSLGTFHGDPLPSQDSTIPLSHGVTGYAFAQIAQPITQLYKIHLSIREQELSADLNGQQYRAKRQSVAADVKEAYYAVLQTESALDVADASVKQYEETDRVSLQYVAQEVVLKSESLDVKAKLAQAKYQVVDLTNTLQTQKEHLNDLLGRDLDTEFRTEQVPSMSLQETDLKVAQQTALSQRPEIKEAEITVQKADYERKKAKADYIPDISAAFHYMTPINTELLPTNIASVGAELNWEPFEWGRRKDEIKQKEISLDQSQIQLKQARAHVLLDVNNQFRKLSQSRAALDVAIAAREAAHEKLREISDKYKTEAVLLRNVLEQQTSVASADHDYEEALLSFWSAKAQFEKALGEE